MKKFSIIVKKFGVNVLLLICALAYVLLTIYAIQIENDVLVWCCIGVLCVVTVWVFWQSHCEIKQDEAVFQEQMKALDYAVELKCGRKLDFVRIQGENMYKYFLERGYIHELHQSQEDGFSPQWELTRLGKLRYEDFHKD